MAAVADWRDDRDYRGLAGCDLQQLAWEWLRRRPDYRAAASRGDQSDAHRFGLHCFERPDRPAREARLWWRREADPAVLVATADAAGPDRVDLLADPRTQLIVERGIEHLLLEGGRGQLRIDIVRGTTQQGAVGLMWQIQGLETGRPALEALGRFLSLRATGRLPRASRPTPAQTRRTAALLRVGDALEAGASQREIALALFGSRMIGASWRSEAGPYRLRVQRLVRAARRIRAQDPLSILRSSRTRLPGGVWSTEDHDAMRSGNFHGL